MEFKNDIVTADEKELILISLEMFFCFLKDFEISKARAVLNELRVALNFNYEISYDLYSLYKYVDKLLVRYQLINDEKQLIQAVDIMVEIEAGFKGIIERKLNTVDLTTYGVNGVNDNYNKSTREFIS